MLHRQPFKQRIQRFFEGVPAEIFVNTPASLRAYLDEEAGAGRPITAHMWATGFVVLDLDPALGRLRAEAARRLATAPAIAEGDATLQRYLAASRFEDARDVVERDPETANMLLSGAVHAMLQGAFLQTGRNVPRDKDLLAALEELDRGVAVAARRFYAAALLPDRLALAAGIADALDQPHGFFAWESSEVPVAID